ncbi:MAG: peptidoglycan DD-metalloendopeptidase family protein [Flavobacteriales bacterium]
MKRILIPAIIILVLGSIAFWALSHKAEEKEEILVMSEPAEPSCIEKMCDIEACDYEIKEGVIPKNSFLSTLLSGYGVAYSTVLLLVEKSQDVFDVTKIRSNQPYYILKSLKDQTVDYFIYKQNTTDFVVFNMTDEEAEVYVYEKPVTTEEKSAEGVIHTSLYDAMEESGMKPSMAIELANVFAWQIDFTRVQPGDEFKVLYDERYCDGELISTGNVKAAILTHSGREFHAYTYDKGYFDDQGKTLQSMFLKSPVEFSRISSKFNKRRRHPIKKRIIPHLGTDYAAPHGTPIIAVADGVITKSSYTGGNGKYVKIRHNDTYETQYLHMSKRAVNVGDAVKQGDVIGYIGSTGLATGPHVCFRFWKNGKQVNHLEENLPVADPLDESRLEEFHVIRKDLRKRLDNTSFSPEF